VKIIRKLSHYSIFCIFLVFTTPHTKADLDPSKLSKQYLLVKRKAKEVEGFYFGLRQGNKQKKVIVKECEFSYDKGQDSHPKNEKEYAYERFKVTFSGMEENGEMSFDSVVYGISDYLDKYKSLDFQNGFPTKELKRIELSEETPVGHLTAIRTDLGELHLLFKHREGHSVTNSTFFAPGEQRDYEMEVQFETFNDKLIKLRTVKIKAYRAEKNNRKKMVAVTCSNFKESED